jgi:uncharacterized protein YacL
MSDDKAAGNTAAKKYNGAMLLLSLLLWVVGIVLSMKMSEVQIPQDPQIRQIFAEQVMLQAFIAATLMSAAPVVTILGLYRPKNWKQRRNRKTLVTAVGGIVFIILMAWWNLL